ncbi:MAG: MoaD/ThiS family protein [Bacillota bacterium]
MTPDPVTVTLYGYLATMAGTRQYTTSPATVGMVLRELASRLPPGARHHLPDPEIGKLFGVHLVLNDTNLTLPAALDHVLRPGDRLSVIAPVTGG